MEFNQDKHIGMTMKEAAVYLRVSISTVKRLIKAGKIPFFKVGGKTLHDKAEVDSYVKRLRSNIELEGIYEDKNELSKPVWSDKNGSGGKGHGQSL